MPCPEPVRGLCLFHLCQTLCQLKDRAQTSWTPDHATLSVEITRLRWAAETLPKRKGLSLHGQVSLPLKQAGDSDPNGQLSAGCIYPNHRSLLLVWKLGPGTRSPSHCGSASRSPERMPLNCFPGLGGCQCYSQSPYSNGSSAFPFALPLKKNHIEVIFKLSLCSTLKITLNLFLKTRGAIFLTELPLPPNSMCYSALMFIQESLKVRRHEKCPVCFIFHCISCFHHKVAIRRGLRDAKMSKPWTQALRTFYFHVGDNKSTYTTAIQSRKNSMKGTEEEHIISLWSLQQRLCGRGNI